MKQVLFALSMLACGACVMAAFWIGMDTFDSYTPLRRQTPAPPHQTGPPSPDALLSRCTGAVGLPVWSPAHRLIAKDMQRLTVCVEKHLQ